MAEKIWKRGALARGRAKHGIADCFLLIADWEASDAVWRAEECRGPLAPLK